MVNLGRPPSIIANHVRSYLTTLDHGRPAFDTLCPFDQPFSLDLGQSIDRPQSTFGDDRPCTVDHSRSNGQSRLIDRCSAARMAYFLCNHVYIIILY